MTGFQSNMARETHETPAAVGRLLDRRMAGILEIGKRLAGMAPPLVATCARGSSDHAAAYLKYVLEIATGTPVVSIGPSIASVYEAPLRLSGVPLVTISQSGQSPDLLALQAAAKTAGALTIAFVNTENSPLAREADIVIPLEAGPERSVAATKSFVASAVAAAGLVAGWTVDFDPDPGAERTSRGFRCRAPRRLVRGCPGAGQAQFVICGGAWPFLSDRTGSCAQKQGNGSASC